MTPTLPNADELEVVAWAETATMDLHPKRRKIVADAGTVLREGKDKFTALVPVTALSSAQAQIDALRAANEALMKERASLIETKRGQIERLTRERDREVARREHTQQWYAERLVKIEDVAKREGLWNEVAAIIANGSGTRQLDDGSYVYDPPTYAQQLNSAKHRAEAAEAEVKRLQPIVEAVAHIGVDFGYGPYELEPHFIEDARTALSGGTSNG